MINTIENFLLKNKFFDIVFFKNECFENIIIATALSKIHIKDMSYQLIKLVKCKYNVKSITMCGINTGWVVINFDIVLVHLLLSDIRNFYRLDSFYIS